MISNQSIVRVHCSRPTRGISADVLIDGFSPGPAKDAFQLEFSHGLVAAYLLQGERGFWRIVPWAQFPKPEFIYLHSEPLDRDQHRVAFGLTLLLDAIQMHAKMGLRLNLHDRTAARFVNAEEPSSCIRFLEALEGIDELSVRYRYIEAFSNNIVRGVISL